MKSILPVFSTNNKSIKCSFVVLTICLSLFFNTLKAETLPIADFLLPNGCLNKDAYVGKYVSFDLSGWHTELDPVLGPVFTPAPPPLAAGWNALSSGVDNAVYAMAVIGNDIYVGGSFIRLGVAGEFMNNIAKWDGTTWTRLGTGLNNAVTCLAVSGSDLYVGGVFSNVESNNMTGISRIAKWDGTAWSALDKGLNNGVNSITVNGGDIYVGGGFTAVGTGGTAVSGLNYIAKWNGSAWSALDKGFNLDVYKVFFSGGNLYVGGDYTNVGAGGTPVSGLNKIALWNGTAWQPLGNGLNNWVYGIAVSGSLVYVSGNFTDIAGGTVSGLNYIAAWNGTNWLALDKGLDATVYTVITNGTDVYAGGVFSGVGAGGTPVTGLNNIAKWNGIAWSALESGLNGGVLSILFSGNVYAGGFFTNVGSGGTPVAGLSRIARLGDVVLSVEFLDFAATPSVKGNLLTWETANETNNKGFEVERQRGNAWEPLGFVASKSSKGTSHSYQFIDNAPLSTSYYRLRQIDNDGKETLSKVVSVINKGTDKLKVYPSVTNHYLTIDTEATADYEIVNLLGQVVGRGKAVSQIDVSALANGSYILKVGDTQAKFVKQ